MKKNLGKIIFISCLGVIVIGLYLKAINDRKGFLLNNNNGFLAGHYRPSFLMAAADVVPASVGNPTNIAASSDSTVSQDKVVNSTPVANQTPLLASPVAASSNSEAKSSPDAQQSVTKNINENIEEDDAGPDTTKLSEEQTGLRGNWVKKRDFLVRAEAQNKKIQELVKGIEAKRGPIWDSFKKIQNEFNDFYKLSSRAEGKLEVVFGVSKEIGEKKIADDLKQKMAFDLNQTTTKIESSVSWYSKALNKCISVWTWAKGLFVKVDKKDEAKTLVKPEQTVSSQSVDLKETLTVDANSVVKPEEKERKPTELDGLKNNLKQIKELDEALVKRFEKLNEELALIVSETGRAQTLQNEMWDMIDDMKARSNFYEIKIITKKIKSIKEYLEGDFVADFESTVDAARIKMKKVAEKIKELEDLGIITADESLPAKLKNELNPTDTTKGVKVLPGNKPAASNDKSIWGRFIGFFGA